MNFVDLLLEKLFPKTNAALESIVPFMEEKIVRGQRFKQHYFRWLNEKKYQTLIKQVVQAWKLGKNNLSVDLTVDAVEFRGANGLVIYYEDFINKEEFDFLFDYLKDKVQNVGYKLYVSDRKIYNKTQRVETVEKHYLKPIPNNLKNDEGGFLADQKYGNILIEQHLHNDKPQYIKLLSNFYADRMYSQALPFDDLINLVLN